MKRGLIICKAVRQEVSDVLRLYSQEDIDNGHILALENANALYDKLSQYPDYNLYVAKFGNVIVGTFALLIMDNLAHAGKPSAIIEDVFVDDQYRSQGIGRKMIEFAMQICREQGCYKLALSSNSKRKRAHRFYEKLGFKKHGYSFLIEV